MRLSVMYDSGRRRWEAWDSAVLPRVCGQGDTPGEALNALIEALEKLRPYAPAWILAKKGT